MFGVEQGRVSGEMFGNAESNVGGVGGWVCEMLVKAESNVGCVGGWVCEC